MKVLIYGFGRMGLTHFSILNSIIDNPIFTIVEPSKVMTKLLDKNLSNITFIRDDSSLSDSFDLTLITAPPFTHVELLKKCIKRNDKKIFVEKPFGGYTNTIMDAVYKNKNIYIGYVLRFNPCIQWIKSNISRKEIISVSGQFLSSTLKKKPVGWRNGSFSGVLNEVGSHVIDLVQFIIGKSDLKVMSSTKQSIISDVDDILNTELKSSENINISFYFNWVKKNIRKPIFNLEINMNDGSCYNIDQQQIIYLDKNKEIIKKISVTDICETVPFYLRGIDFTKQMQDLISDCKTIAKVDEAIEVNNIIKKILKHENNFR